MDCTIDNGELGIALPVFNELAPSSSGKTLLVASTRGPQVTNAMVKGPDGEKWPVIVSVNAYIKCPMNAARDGAPKVGLRPDAAKQA